MTSIEIPIRSAIAAPGRSRRHGLAWRGVALRIGSQHARTLAVWTAAVALAVGYVV